MTSREVVLQYLRCFCAGDVAVIEKLLCTDLLFKGPLHQFSSTESYINSLRQDPPGECSCNILSITEGDKAVALFYEYVKRDNKLLIAQYFKFRQNMIGEILIVFDTASLILHH